MAFDEQDALRLAHAAQYMLQLADELEEILIESRSDDVSIKLPSEVIHAASTIEIGLGLLRKVLTEKTEALITKACGVNPIAPAGHSSAHHWSLTAGETSLKSLVGCIHPALRQPRSSDEWLALISEEHSIRLPESRSCQKFGFGHWMEIAPKVVDEATRLIAFLQGQQTDKESGSPMCLRVDAGDVKVKSPRSKRGGRRRIPDETIQMFLEYRREFELAKQRGDFDRKRFLQNHQIDSVEHKRRLNNTTPSKLKKRGLSSS